MGPRETERSFVRFQAASLQALTIAFTCKDQEEGKFPEGEVTALDVWAASIVSWIVVERPSSQP
jgi:hypothetical protein